VRKSDERPGHVVGGFSTACCHEAEFLDVIGTKVLRVVLLVSHKSRCSFASRFLFLKTHATSYNFYSSATVHCKEKGGKPGERSGSRTA
jgi:hypothetical protein